MEKLTTRQAEVLDILSTLTSFDRSALTPDLHLVADIGLDSVVAMDLIMQIEESLDIEVSPEEAAELETVGDLLTKVVNWEK